MWCTRWYLPLLFLPLPIASPYFLVLFILSLTLHAKPCFYCIVLLTTLFVSSCYWQPLPMDSHLFSPWSANVTTFGEALNKSLSPTYSGPMPSVMRLMDRCWCDFTTYDFFQPFNVSEWERVSVEKTKVELEHKQAELEAKQEEEAHSRAGSLYIPRTVPPIPKPTATPSSSQIQQGRSMLWSLFTNMRSSAQDMLSDKNATSKESVGVSKKLPLLRSEYDLRDYGFDVIIDFSWAQY